MKNWNSERVFAEICVYTATFIILLGIPLMILLAIKGIFDCVSSTPHKRVSKRLSRILIAIETIILFLIFNNQQGMQAFIEIKTLIVFTICAFHIILFQIMKEKDIIIKNENFCMRKFVGTIFGIMIVLLMLLITTTLQADKGAFGAMVVGEYGGIEQILRTVVNMIYFIVISMLTIGYGDIVPLSIGAKIDTLIISISGFILLVVFLNFFIAHGNNVSKNKSAE